jgi:hypothetical protein
MNKTKRFHGWMAVQVEPTQSEPPKHFPSRLNYYSCLFDLGIQKKLWINTRSLYSVTV